MMGNNNTELAYVDIVLFVLKVTTGGSERDIIYTYSVVTPSSKFT